MERPQTRARPLTWRLGAVAGAATATAVALAAFAPTASADPVSVGYGSCQSNKPSLAPAPPDYTTTVTLKPQGSSFQAGKPITITWHYSTSTAPGPVGIPAANVATAQAKIVIGGAASSSVTAGPSSVFPPAPVKAGDTFQIPDMTATFTPTAAGTYTLTPGDNEQDVSAFGVVVTCKATAPGPAATITVAAASGAGTTAPSTTTPAASTSSATSGVLPHTGFDGRRLFGGAALAAVLGGTGLYATRRRRGSHF
jgi:hypothetical protein